MAKKTPVVLRPLAEDKPKSKSPLFRFITPQGPVADFYRSLAENDPLTGQPRYQFNPYIKAAEYFQRFRIPKFTKVGEGKEATKIPSRISGSFCLVSKKQDKKTGRSGFAVERKYIVNPDWAPKSRDAAESKDKTKKPMPTVADMIKSQEWKQAKFLESSPLAAVEGYENSTQSMANIFDQGYFGTPNDEFVAIQPGPFNKQKYMYDYLKAHGWCFHFKNHSALAQALVNTKTNYVMGKGVQITALNDDLDEFIQDYIRVNDRQTNWGMNCAATVWAGEFMDQKRTTLFEQIPLISNCVDLMSKYRGKIFPTPMPKDVSGCWEIVTELTNINNPFYYHFQYQTQYQMTYKSGDKAAEYVIEDIPADEILHTRVNVVQGEKRGRADLECVLPWLKLEEDYQKSKSFRAFVEASFVMKTKIMGDDDDVDRYKDDPEVNRIPVPGSKIIENEAVDTTFLETKGSSGSGSDEVGGALLAKCAVGVGLSPDMVGAHSGSGGSGRQSGLMKAEPAHKSLEMRQTTMELSIRREIDWAINIARQNGLIPTTQLRKASTQAISQALRKRDWKAIMREAASLITMQDVEEPLEMSYEVTFPEILSEDRKDKIAMLQVCEAQGWYDNERAGNMAAKELNDTTYDWGKVKEKLKEEAQQDPKVQAMYQPQPGQPGQQTQPPRPRPAQPQPPQQNEPPKAGSGADKARFAQNAKRK